MYEQELQIYLTICAVIIILYCVYITYLLFQNLFEFHRSVICIQFSEKHNWLFEPHCTTKISAILSTIAFAFYGISYIFVTYILTVNVETNKITYIPEAGGHLLYYFYLLSGIKNLMKKEPLFNIKVSSRLWYLTLIVIFIKIIAFLLYYTIYYFHSYNVLATTVYEHISVGTLIFIDFSLLCLFIHGQNNIYKFWYSKCYKEFKTYKETQRGHEALIKITRYTVTGSFSVVMNFIDTTFNSIIYPRIGPNSVEDISEWKNFVLNIIIASLRVVDIMTFVMAIYFMFEFGYTSYRNCCSKCHHIVYKCCEKCHHKQIESGDGYVNYYDGIQYPADGYGLEKGETCCCCLCFGQTDAELIVEQYIPINDNAQQKINEMSSYPMT